MEAPPTELNILENFLLPPASLHALISLKTFTTLFPHSQRSSPTIRALYRDLQSQKLQTINQVKQDIIDEARRGSQQRRAIVRARRNQKNDGPYDEEIELEENVFGQYCNFPVSKPHTLNSILPELSMAVVDLKTEIDELQREERLIRDEIEDLVGGLSDLKYGKFENPRIREQVLERCLRIEKLCDNK